MSDTFKVIGTNYPDADRDAALIAVAPELLAVMKRLLAEAGEGSIDGRAIDLLPKTTIDAALNCVAKAERRTPSPRAKGGVGT